MPAIFTKRNKPQIMFANCGHKDTRRLEDNAKLGFISAGQGREEEQEEFYFSNQIRNLIIGDILCVYRNKIGYVGIARVISKPTIITEAFFDGVPANNEMFSDDANMFRNADHPGYEECLVKIKWLSEVHLGDDLGSGKCYGEFANQLITCSLRNQRHLKTNLQIEFKLDFDKLLKNIDEFEIQNEEDEISFPEGREIFILHKTKERNRAVVKIAKEKYCKENPLMQCQVCSFSFKEKYGELGEGFIEAHHIYPLSELTEETKTKIDDLIFVCSNCHRMLHRRRPWLSKLDLDKLLIN